MGSVKAGGWGGQRLGGHRRREKAFQLSVLRLKPASSDRDLVFSGVLWEMEQEIKGNVDVFNKIKGEKWRNLT